MPTQLKDPVTAPDSPGRRQSLPARILCFYVDGFRQMTVGRSLWLLILIKLFIIFFVLKLFFFPDLLSRDYDNDDDRASAVRRSMIDRTPGR